MENKMPKITVAVFGGAELVDTLARYWRVRDIRSFLSLEAHTLKRFAKTDCASAARKMISV